MLPFIHINNSVPFYGTYKLVPQDNWQTLRSGLQGNPFDWATSTTLRWTHNIQTSFDKCDFSLNVFPSFATINGAIRHLYFRIKCLLVDLMMDAMTQDANSTDFHLMGVLEIDLLHTYVQYLYNRSLWQRVDSFFDTQKNKKLLPYLFSPSLS